MTEEAAPWNLRIQEGLSQSEFRAWRQWLTEDDARARAFDAVSTFWQESEQVNDLPWPTDQELEADSYDPLVALSPPEKATLKIQVPKNSKRPWLAIAASIATVSILGAVLFQGLGQKKADFHTAIAKHQVILLEDGPSVTLGAHSNVTVTFDGDIRHLTLEYGETYFKVAKNSTRPFVVAADTRTVRAIGTEFNVSIGVRDIKVSVVEGQVRVEGPPMQSINKALSLESAAVLNLKPGNVLDFNTKGGIGVVSQVDPLLTASWLDRRLAYVGVPLESVIADVNRYSETELITGDQATEQLSFTGTTFSDDIGDWLAVWLISSRVQGLAKPSFV